MILMQFFEHFMNKWFLHHLGYMNWITDFFKFKTLICICEQKRTDCCSVTIVHVDFHNAVCNFDFCFNTRFDVTVQDASEAGVLRVFAVLLPHSKAMWSWSAANFGFYLWPFVVSAGHWVHPTCATRGSARNNLFDLALLHQFQMFRVSKSCHRLDREGSPCTRPVTFPLFERHQLVGTDRRRANSVKISKINQALLFYF